jgi:hypothetical protein
MTERLEIPAHCFDSKPLFADAPGRDVVDEVRVWVKTNPVYLWRGHTHSKPDAVEAGQIRYINDFVLPKGVESPCPCCTPYHAKFGKGYIAWFPLTGNLRLMGQDCFRTLNPEGHDFAVSELEERIKQESEQQFLLSNLGKIPAIISGIRAAEPIAEYLDDLRDILGARLQMRTGINLWSLVRSGSLNLVVETAEGATASYYATVAGVGLLDPARRRYARALAMAKAAIGAINLPFDPLRASDADRSVAAKLMTRGTKYAHDTLSAMAQGRLFVSVLNTATLRNWAAQENAPARLYIRRDGLQLQVGVNEKEVQCIPLNPVIEQSIPRLPD